MKKRSRASTKIEFFRLKDDRSRGGFAAEYLGPNNLPRTIPLFACTMRPDFGLSIILSLCVFLSGSAQIQSRSLAPLPDQARDDAIGFAIGGKGYIVGGRKNDFAISDQLWSYDPASDAWESKSPLPGIPRQYASAFVLAGKAYLFGGLADPGLRLDEVWRYDPTNESWQQLSDFPGGARFAPISFVLDGHAYAGLGKGADALYEDLWKYDQTSDSWELITHLPQALYQSVAIPMGNEMVIGLGVDSAEQFVSKVWIFDGSALRQASSVDEAIGYSDVVQVASLGLVIGGKTDALEAVNGIAVMNIQCGPRSCDDITWSGVDGMADGAKRNGASFTIGEKGYYFGGKNELGVKSNALIEFSRSLIEEPIRMYPNPSADHITIESDQAFERIEVYDMQGQRLLAEQVSQARRSVSLDLSGVSMGIYILRIDGGEGLRLIKIE